MKQIEYWESRAKLYGDTIKAVNNDIFMEELEYKEILNLIKGNERILDLGCGNGLLLEQIKKKYPKCELKGVELTKSLTDMAIKKGLDVLRCSSSDPDLPDEMPKFDIIITKRLIVNLNHEDTINTLYNIKEMLNENGKYIMIECFKKPLKKINELRKQLKLETIKVDKQHNHYLDDSFPDYVNLVLHKVKIQEIDFGSFYYLISRTLSNSLGFKDYDVKLLNRITKMNVNIKGYCPEVIYVYE